MAAQMILVHFVQVRILVGQPLKKRSLAGTLFSSDGESLIVAFENQNAGGIVGRRSENFCF